MKRGTENGQDLEEYIAFPPRFHSVILKSKKGTCDIIFPFNYKKEFLVVKVFLSV